MNKDAHLTLNELVARNTPALPNEQCWPWQGAKIKTGYGVVGHQRKRYKAHRASFVIHRGQIPVGMFVCHHCDNPSCVNPLHLFLGTPQDNMTDKVLKGRQSRGEAHAMSFAKSTKYQSAIVRGEKHGRSKLLDSQRDHIIRLLNDGDLTQHQIAQMFNITQSNVSVINRRWRAR
jgi:HNH endonuclease/Sigma-70, region 4